jgi:hypothetical protein
VVSFDEEELTVEFVQPALDNVCPIFEWSEVAQVENSFVGTNTLIPVLEKGVVHLAHRIERSLAVFDDVFMSEMEIGCNVGHRSSREMWVPVLELTVWSWMLCVDI